MQQHGWIRLSRYDSPLGLVGVAIDGAGLRALDFVETESVIQERLRRHAPRARYENGDTPEVADRLEAYFGGDLDALDCLPVAAMGTPFQRRVWDALRGIRPGCTASYLEIARTIGQPGAVRAVGSANAKNPVALVVPCHRVIGATGSLCGYAGGVWRKEWLLRHEGAILAARSGGARGRRGSDAGSNRPLLGTPGRP